MSGVVRKILGILTIVVLIFLGIDSASAHTSLVSSTPKNGSTLDSAPTEISLQFDEDLITIGDKDPNKISLRDESGNEISIGQTKVIGSIVSATLSPALLKSGLYTVSYRVVSADGHVVGSQIQFRLNLSPQDSTNQNSNSDSKNPSPQRSVAARTAIPAPTTSDNPTPINSNEDLTETANENHHHSSLIHKHFAHVIYGITGLALLFVWAIVRRRR